MSHKDNFDFAGHSVNQEAPEVSSRGSWLRCTPSLISLHCFSCVKYTCGEGKRGGYSKWGGGVLGMYNLVLTLFLLDTSFRRLLDCLYLI